MVGMRNVITIVMKFFTKRFSYVQSESVVYNRVFDSSFHDGIKYEKGTHPAHHAVLGKSVGN